MKLSIVMPVYNEERTLEEIVAAVLATPYEKELILVNDASRDRSAEIMEALAEQHPQIRCFHHEVNRGKGAALATGFKEIQGLFMSAMRSKKDGLILLPKKNILKASVLLMEKNIIFNIKFNNIFNNQFKIILLLFFI